MTYCISLKALSRANSPAFVFIKHLYMLIKDIFSRQILITDLLAAIVDYNKRLGAAWDAWHKAGGFPNVDFMEYGAVKHTTVAHYSHIVKELIKLLPPIEKPEWLFIGTFTTCYSYADMRKEVSGDYKTILRLFYNPLRIEITAPNKRNYPEVLELAKKQLKRLQARVNEPLIVTASGQTTDLGLSNGPDVIIVK